MGLVEIWLGIGTSMFAAIAIGLGVDFSIPFLERFILLINEKQSLKQAVAQFYPSTGRVLLFNFLSVGLGFGVLMISHVIPLVRFGALVAIGISVIASVTLIPSCIKLFKPSIPTSIVKKVTLLRFLQYEPLINYCRINLCLSSITTLHRVELSLDKSLLQTASEVVENKRSK